MKFFVYGLREFDELEYFEKYSRQYGMEYAYTTERPSEDNYDLAKGYDGVSILYTPTPASMIDALKAGGVRIISSRTIGYDHIDIAHGESVGMGIANVTYDPSAVADYTIMCMLECCRKVQTIRNASGYPDFYLKGKVGKDINKCTVGIIGAGRIGGTVVKHLQGFGCKVIAYDIRERDDIRKYAEYVDFDTLLKESDIITLHAPANDDTYHMIDDFGFAKMKDGVILINCARGQLVDTDALVRAIKSGKVSQAAIDCFEDEGAVDNRNPENEGAIVPRMEELKNSGRVLLSPHIAFYTETSVANMVENSILAIKSYLEGEDNPCIIVK